MFSPRLRASRGGRSDSSQQNVRDTMLKNGSAAESRKEPASISRPSLPKRSFTVTQVGVSQKKSRDVDLNRENRIKHHVLRKASSVPKMLESGKVLSTQPNREADPGQNPQDFDVTKEKMKRSMTDSDIYDSREFSRSPLLQLFRIFQRNAPEPATRMLVSVTMLGCMWEVRLIVRSHETVKDVTKAALTAYTKEGRMLPQGCDAEAYELHYSQFSLESLHPEDRLVSLGARSFVLCRKRDQPQNSGAAGKEAKRWWNVLGLVSGWAKIEEGEKKMLVS